MTTPFLIPDIERDEGTVPTAYPDPRSPLAVACREAGIDPIHYPTFQNWQKLSGAPWTIGCGHCGKEVHPGLLWSKAQIDAALQTDVGAVERGLDTAIPWWEQLNDARQDVLVNMGFNMGVHGLLEWPHMLGAAKAGDFDTAASQMLWKVPPAPGVNGVLNVWAHEVGGRAKRLAEQMKTGQRAA